MANSIPYGRQSIDEEDIRAVVEALRSDFLTQGPAIDRFEKVVAEQCGAKFAIAVSNATAALHIGARALDLGPGDILWTSPVTFVASANCALYCGAKVDFVDIDPRTYNMSVAALASKLEEAEKLGRLPKLIVPVHLAGQSCEMAPIRELADRYGVRIMEDASHAIGGTYQENPIGSCRFSDLAIFSFHPVKIITTGEGGMILTNSPELNGKLRRLRSHGITREPAEMTHASDGPWYYQQIDLGWNYRITDIQAALGISQMGRLKRFIDARQKIAAYYDENLRHLPITIPWQHPHSKSSYHLYIIRLKLERVKKSHRQVFESLREQGIIVNLHYIPVHTQPYYQGLGFAQGMFPESEMYYREAISLPIFPDLTENDLQRVVSALEKALG
jgi:UDP-4-amino-4,6-dideoxy-N-acetyl-beta-L-altrosamine transaminase